MTFSDTSRRQIQEFISSDLYRRIKDHVFDSLEVRVMGSTRDPGQIGMDLAALHGARLAFKEIESIPHPKETIESPTPNHINKRTKH